MNEGTVNDAIFLKACREQKIDLVKQMCKQNNRYEILAEKNKIIGYSITKLKCKFIEKVNNNIHICNICYSKSNVKTSCKHYGCEDCFIRWGRKNCPVCRRKVEYYIQII